MMVEAKKPEKEVVYLDVDDDITTVVDKVEGAKHKIVALVLPKRFATLQSIVNMRLLKRSAGSAAKNVVLITNEPELLPLAGAAGLHVAKNLQSKPEIPPSPVEPPAERPVLPADPDAELDANDTKLDYHRSIGGLAATSTADETEAIPLDDAEPEPTAEVTTKKPAKDKKLKVPNFERFRLLLAAGAVGLVLLIIFIILAIFVWPKAVVTLQAEATPLGTSFELTTSASAKKLDQKNGLIPAQLKSSDFKTRQEVEATGQKNKGKKATGSVSMTAKKCSGNPFNPPKNVPAGTGISTDGLYYITQGNTSFHGTGTDDSNCYLYESDNDTSIVAQSGGEKYNVSDAEFDVPSRSDVSATGSAHGGTDDIQTVLSQQDVDGAKSKLSNKDKNKFAADLKQQLDDDGFYVIEATFKAGSPQISASPAVGQPASTANVTITISYSTLVVEKTDLKKAVTHELNKQIDKTKQKIGTDDVLKDLTVNLQSQRSPTEAILSISLNTTALPIIDEAAIKKQIAGQKSGDIRALLEGYPGIKSVDVKMSPFWVSKAPKKPSHIIIIQQPVEKKTGSGS